MAEKVSEVHVRQQRESPLADRACRELRRRIAVGAYPPDAYLPPERELALDLGVGRSTLRNGLHQLAEEGLLVREQGRGTRVQSPFGRRTQDVVGVFYHTSFSNAWLRPETVLIVQGIQDALSRLGHKFESLSDRGPLATTEAIEKRFAGALFVDVARGRTPFIDLERRRFPVVLANIEWDLAVSGTWVDRGKTTRKAVNTLAAMGHRRIAFVTRDPSRYFYGQSRQGYLAGLEDAHIAPDESLVAVSTSPNPLAAYLATKPLFEAAHPPTAIVAARDVLAHGACQAATESGAVIGRDVSIIGFDDNSWPREDPFLTTFREPC